MFTTPEGIPVKGSSALTGRSGLAVLMSAELLETQEMAPIGGSVVLGEVPASVRVSVGRGPVSEGRDVGLPGPSVWAGVSSRRTKCATVRPTIRPTTRHRAAVKA